MKEARDHICWCAHVVVKQINVDTLFLCTDKLISTPVVYVTIHFLYVVMCVQYLHLSKEINTVCPLIRILNLFVDVSYVR